MPKYADVILPLPLQESFTYALPLQSDVLPQVGCRVIVPFGSRKTYTAIVVRLHSETPPYPTKTVSEVLDAAPVVLPEQLSLWQWIADYYLCSMGEVFKAALPAALKASPTPSKGGRKGKSVGVFPTPIENGAGEAAPLSDVQQQAMDSIIDKWRTHSICLLHGVTSSGKTEIYIHLMQRAIKEGKQVLFMLPEIVLTTQLTERLRRVFGSRLGVYHSRNSDRERMELYRKMLSDEPYDIVVGVRSSIFLPFQRLGLLIIDEEHETSFKQQDPAPRYHARNVALVLAARAGAKALLGSATPSLESYHNALIGKYGLVMLKTRYAGLSLPTIEVVDVQEMQRKKMMTGIFSPQLLAHIRKALDERKQVILFQNRRGYAPVMECRVCGWTPRCQSCDVSLTVHRGFRQMVCHYCGKSYSIPSVCPNCEERELSSRGYGTERIEEQLQRILPEARIARMDLDTTRSRQNYEQILHDFEQGNTDILIGTQMVTKGLDFDRVSLVGILSADSMLSQPDFRSYERAFQLMEQVAGRAGRKGAVGHVVLQTRDAGNDIVRQVVAHNYEGMYAQQSQERELFRYPPFCRVVFLYLKHRNEQVVESLATDFASLLRQVFGERVLGPDTPPVSRVQLMHIRKLILKVEPAVPMSAVRQRLVALQSQILAMPQYRSAQIYYDVD
ncbi:MAG: primosomal protein N' [Bacteroidaceae bacterium]|nr:primosomal protein N' [Bacteroidaceae bacterium]